MKSLRALPFALMVCVPVSCVAQDISSVETKPYGSYVGGSIDTVDLASGNLFLNIPLISYAQLGKLPPLAFGIALNNAPYNMIPHTQENYTSGPDISDFATIRYDPSAPGGNPNFTVLPSPPCPGGVPCLNSTITHTVLGAYVTSSYEGGFAVGTYSYSTPPCESSGPPCPFDEAQQFSYRVVDAEGSTHDLGEDINNLNMYYAKDGSGHAFSPSFQSGDNPYGSLSPTNFDEGQNSGLASYAYWNYGSVNATGTSWDGVRAGTVYSPSGVQATNQFVSTSLVNQANPPYDRSVRLLKTTFSDASGVNQIVRSPWYWSNTNQTASQINAFYGSPGSSNYPYFTDSVGRKIPDILSLQVPVISADSIGQPPSGCPAVTSAQHPQPNATLAISWPVPGPNGQTLTYIFCYVTLTINMAWQPEPQTQALQWDINSFDPVQGTGFALQSVVLPDGVSSWKFIYDQGTGAGGTTDLLEVIFPTGGNIQYQYGYATPVDGVVARSVASSRSG